MKFDYIKCSEDRRYLSLGNLLMSLKEVANKNGNIRLCSYLDLISMSIKMNDIEWLIKTEKCVLSKNFLTQREFKGVDREFMVPIIREYKLEQLVEQLV
jgi:replicative DNA helicase